MDWTGKNAHYAHHGNRLRSHNSDPRSYNELLNPSLSHQLPPNESSFLSRYSEKNIPSKIDTQFSSGDYSSPQRKSNLGADQPINPFLRRTTLTSKNGSNNLQKDLHNSPDKTRNPFLKPTLLSSTSEVSNDFNKLRKDSLVRLSHILPDYLRQKVEWKPDQITALKELRADIVELSLLPSGVDENQQRCTWEHLNTGINKLVSLNQPLKDINSSEPILQLENRKIVIQDIVSHLQNLEKKLIAAGIAFSEQSNRTTDDQEILNQSPDSARHDRFRKHTDQLPSSNSYQREFDSASRSRSSEYKRDDSKKFKEPDSRIEQFRTKSFDTDAVNFPNVQASREPNSRSDQNMGWGDPRWPSDTSDLYGRSDQSNFGKSASPTTTRLETYSHDPAEHKRYNESRDNFRSTSKYENMPHESPNYCDDIDKRTVHKTGDVLGSRIHAYENPTQGFVTSRDSDRKFDRKDNATTSLDNTVYSDLSDKFTGSYQKERIPKEALSSMYDSSNYSSETFSTRKEIRSEFNPTFNHYKTFPTSSEGDNFDRRKVNYPEPPIYSKDTAWHDHTRPSSSSETFQTPKFQDNSNRSDYFRENQLKIGSNKEDTRRVFIKLGDTEHRKDYQPIHADNQKRSEITHSGYQFGSVSLKRKSYSTYDPTNYDAVETINKNPNPIGDFKSSSADDISKTANFGRANYSGYIESEQMFTTTYPAQSTYQAGENVLTLPTSDYWRRPDIPKDFNLSGLPTEVSQKRSLPVWEFGGDKVETLKKINKDANTNVSQSSPEKPVQAITLLQFEIIEQRLKALEHYKNQVRKDMNFLSHIESSLRSAKDGDVTDFLKENKSIEREIRNADQKLTREIKNLSKIVNKYTKLFKPSGLLIYKDMKDYWCPDCNIISVTIEEALKHLNTEQHKGKMKSVPNCFNQETCWQKKRPVCVGPAHGAEFLYYCDRMLCCTLCEKVFGDEQHALSHLQSITHNSVYKTWSSKRETYDAENLKGKKACLEKIVKEKQKAKEEQEQRRKERNAKERENSDKMKAPVSDIWKEVSDAEQSDTNSKKDLDLEITKFIPPSLTYKNRKQDQLTKKVANHAMTSSNHRNSDRNSASKSPSTASSDNSPNSRDNNGSSSSKQAPLLAAVNTSAATNSLNVAGSSNSVEKSYNKTPIKQAPLLEAGNLKQSSNTGSEEASKSKELKRKIDESVKKTVEAIDIFDIDNNDTMSEPPVKKKLPPLLTTEAKYENDVSEKLPDEKASSPNVHGEDDSLSTPFVPRNIVKGITLCSQVGDSQSSHGNDGSQSTCDDKEKSHKDRPSSLNHIDKGVLPPPVKILPRKLRKK